jgi:myo-inositol-1(or 4)-monophosphatase
VSVALRREALVEVLGAAATIVRDGAAAPLDIAVKSDGSPVTAIDREVDAFLRRELTRLVPGSAWLSEETADDRERLSRELTWIVDPIDGTKELVARRPEIAIAIALVRGGRVVAAGLENPMTQERGSFVQGAAPVFERLSPRAVPRALAEVEAIVSRTETEASDLAGLEDLVLKTRPVGSVAYKLLRVAAGADHVTYSVRPKSEWDVCAGVGLVEAAGKAYLRLDGEPNRFNRPDTTIRSGAVAGPEPLAEALRRKLLARLGGPLLARRSGRRI